jgi:BMFP domain-containing protein YqiC
VSRNEFQAAVLAFLDQFIGRGAAQDIRELRTRLAVDEKVRKLLDDQLPKDDPSQREAFDAMRKNSVLVLRGHCGTLAQAMSLSPGADDFVQPWTAVCIRVTLPRVKQNRIPSIDVPFLVAW